MLQQESDIREQKKSAINEATRKYAEELSNAPQGQHVGAREEALRFADDASKYMLMQDRLLKSGQLNPKDYMIARQNLTDGTKKAFSSMKGFQENYGKLMERARTDVSSAIELKRLAKVESYGNFRDSGFFIDAPTGSVNVGLKEYQDIGGQKVMALKSGSTRGMQYIDGAIYGQIDKFKYLDPLKKLADTYGKEIRTIIDPATLSTIGTIKSIEDIRQRKDIDPITKKVLFDFMSSAKNAINGVIGPGNPNQRGSLLVDTMGYEWTDDPEEAKKNPKMILEVVDPNTGRGELTFTEAQKQASDDFMLQQLLGMLDRGEEVKTIGQVQRQDPRAPTAPEIDRQATEADNLAAAGYWNTIYNGKTLADKQAAADILLGTPNARSAGLIGIDVGTDNTISLKYSDAVKNRTIKFTDNNNNPIPLSQFSALGAELHNVVDRNKAVRAGGGGGAFVPVTGNISSARQGQSAAAKPITIPLAAITEKSQNAVTSLQSSLPEGFTAKDTGGTFGNTLQITAPNGKVYKYSSDKAVTPAEIIKNDIEKFIRDNQNTNPQPNPAPNAKTKPKPKPTTTTQGNVR
jgi:hypothetical protein